MSVEKILASAINNDLTQLKVLSQNVANVNTPGYLNQQSFVALVDGQSQLKTEVSTATSAVNLTGNNLDIAVKDQGFLLIEVNDQQYLSKSGRLSVDSEGWLKHISGGYVLGQSGRIQVPTQNHSALVFNAEGDLTFNGETVDRLQLVTPNQGVSLNVMGNNLYQVQNNQYSPSNALIIPGALNGSSVESSEQMIKMIELSRHLQTMQKAALAYDQLLNAGINELGKK